METKTNVRPVATYADKIEMSFAEMQAHKREVLRRLAELRAEDAALVADLEKTQAEFKELEAKKEREVAHLSEPEFTALQNRILYLYPRIRGLKDELEGCRGVRREVAWDLGSLNGKLFRREAEDLGREIRKCCGDKVLRALAALNLSGTTNFAYIVDGLFQLQSTEAKQKYQKFVEELRSGEQPEEGNG